MKAKFQTSDWRSLELHRQVAARLRNQPELVQYAILNIERWEKQNTSTSAREWLPHIQKGLDHLLAFMLSETDEGQRLRSSSPFIGDCFITQEERSKIFEKFKA